MAEALDKILKKIAALRARAADAASSENEAAIAARKAQELLDLHNLTLSEVDARAEGVQRKEWDSGKSKAPAVTWAGPSIEEALGVRIFYSGGIISVVGSPADVEVALYYLDLVHNAAWRRWAIFQQSDDYKQLKELGRNIRKFGSSYRKGLVMRLGQRIKNQAEEARKRHPTSSSSGQSLVVVKGQMLNQWLSDNRIKITTASGHAPLDNTGVAFGMRDAQNVAIGSGIGSTRTVQLSLAGGVS